MGDMGLAGMAGAAGAGDALQQIFQQRMAAAESDRRNRQLEQQDALTRLKIAEHADEIQQRVEGQKQAEKDKAEAAKAALQLRQDAQAATTFAMQPVGADLGATQGPRAQQLGLPVTKIAGPQVQQTTGFMPLPSAPSQGPGMQTISGLTPINGPQAPAGQSSTTTDTQSPLNAPDTFKRGATQADVVKQREDAQAAGNQDWKNSIAQELATLKENAPPKAAPQQHFSPLPQFDESGKPLAPMAFDLNTGTARAIPGVGANKAAPGAAAVAATAERKKTGLNAVSRVEKDIEDADAAGLIGPGSGRLYSAMASLGTTGDPHKDELIGRLKADLLLTKMHVDSGIGGARAAASPLLLKNWEDIAMKSSKDLLHGYTRAIREDMTPSQTTTSASKPTAEELIKKYGGS